MVNTETAASTPFPYDEQFIREHLLRTQGHITPEQEAEIAANVAASDARMASYVAQRPT